MKTKKQNKTKLPPADQYFVEFGNCLAKLHGQLEQMPARDESPADRIKYHLEAALNIIGLQLLSNLEKRKGKTFNLPKNNK